VIHGNINPNQNNYTWQSSVDPLKKNRIDIHTSNFLTQFCTSCKKINAPLSDHRSIIMCLTKPYCQRGPG
jgi:hypothetical protein